MRNLANVLTVLLASVLAWQVLVWVTGIPPFILPGPERVARSLWYDRALIAENAWITMAEVVIGLVLGVLVGALTALHLMMSRVARQFLVPFLVFNQAVPVFAIAPILTLWFGYGMISKIIVTVLVVYFPVTWTFYDGLRRTDSGQLDLARIMGASEGRMLWYIRMPAALPALGSGLKLAAIYAPIGAVFGEWVGASKGLGYLMLVSNGRSKIDRMIAALIVLALFTVLLHAFAKLLADRMTCWSTRVSARDQSDQGS